MLKWKTFCSSQSVGSPLTSRVTGGGAKRQNRPLPLMHLPGDYDTTDDAPYIDFLRARLRKFLLNAPALP